MSIVGILFRSDFIHEVKQENNTGNIINNSLIQKMYFPLKQKTKMKFPSTHKSY